MNIALAIMNIGGILILFSVAVVCITISGFAFNYARKLPFDAIDAASEKRAAKQGFAVFFLLGLVFIVLTMEAMKTAMNVIA